MSEVDRFSRALISKARMLARSRLAPPACSRSASASPAAIPNTAKCAELKNVSSASSAFIMSALA